LPTTMVRLCFILLYHFFSLHIASRPCGNLNQMVVPAIFV
jgi:hypothetical protein